MYQRRGRRQSRRPQQMHPGFMHPAMTQGELRPQMQGDYGINQHPDFLGWGGGYPPGGLGQHPGQAAMMGRGGFPGPMQGHPMQGPMFQPAMMGCGGPPNWRVSR